MGLENEKINEKKDGDGKNNDLNDVQKKRAKAL